MAKKKSKKSADYVGFRAKHEQQKEEFYNRAETLKDKGFTKADIFEAGLLALENGNSEEQLLRKKNVLINERDSYLKKASDNNKRIEAYNRQLKNRFSRYEKLDFKDNVLPIQVFDTEGNEHNF